MRACAILVAFAAASVCVADDKKDEKPVVKEIPTRDLKLNPARGKATEPTTIASAEELAKNPVLKDAADDVKKQVNFEKQKLVLFAWAGSGQDRVTASIGSEGGKPIVYAEYIRGLTRDLRTHVRLFAVPKDLKVVVDVGK